MHKGGEAAMHGFAGLLGYGECGVAPNVRRCDDDLRVDELLVELGVLALLV